MSDSAPPSANPRALIQELFRQAPLYAIVDTALRPDLAPPTIAEALLSGGVRVIQFRHKGPFRRKNFEACSAMAEQVSRAGGLFIVNDRADVAALCGAAGVHLGQEDLPPEKARAFLGAGGMVRGGGPKLIGYSTHSREQAAIAENLSVDYIAIGPVFMTMTKVNPDPVVGVATVAAVRALTDKPLVAIGGITLENAPTVLQAGADAVAIASDLVKETGVKGSGIEKRVRQFLSSVHGGGSK